MRRKEREVTNDKTIDEIIRKCECCRLGFYDTENSEVYIVPLNFGFEHEDGERVFYFHSAKVGRKIDIAKLNTRVGFELDLTHKIVTGNKADDYTTQYQSVIGTGNISFADDFDEKKKALQSLMYSVTQKRDWEITDAMVESVCILKLVVAKISCKQNMPL